MQAQVKQRKAALKRWKAPYICLSCGCVTPACMVTLWKLPGTAAVPGGRGVGQHVGFRKVNQVHHRSHRRGCDMDVNGQLQEFHSGELNTMCVVSARRADLVIMGCPVYCLCLCPCARSGSVNQEFCPLVQLDVGLDNTQGAYPPVP